ncbi:hypothetical protein KR200_006410, partial [Drosophila serrata]
RTRYMPYNVNRNGVDPSLSSHLSEHQQSQQQKMSSYIYHYATIHQQHGNLNLKQTMPSAISPIAHSTQFFSSASTINSVKSLENPPLVTSVVMPCSSVVTTVVGNGVLGGTVCNDNEGRNFHNGSDVDDAVTLQITNLDYSLDDSSLRSFLMNQLNPITPVVSLVLEGSSYAKVTVPDLYFAKQVVSNLHRKKIGHKRMLVSYTRDSSTTEVNTLRCQVAGLLKDVPYYTLPMYKFRELFQSRFKTSISVLDLYKMQDICTINSDNKEEKFISLQPDLVNTLESSPLMEGLQHSVPYCTVHFKREQHKGWAEQDLEPLPNVCMKISEIQQLIYPLLKMHPGDIPVATLIHCIEGQLKVPIVANDRGINLEHLICCVQGIQIQVNTFGIKILGWFELNKELKPSSSMESINCIHNKNNSNLSVSDRSCFFKNSAADPLFQISREVIELVKMSPKSTIKFNRFIPAYHNHFGKQCRVADYGYTKLIELFEALSSIVQIMGDGEYRQITLTHRTQIRRFTSDLFRVLRASGNNSLLLSQLPVIFSQTQSRNFDVTDYGVCDIVDILDSLVNSNIIVLSPVHNGKDKLISMPKRKQTSSELEKTFVFAGEMVELFQNALQYTILFQKFVRSYHYHFGYQCRLSDYGFLKLADLLDAITGLIDMETTNDEDKKIVLSPTIARRVFAEQCETLIRNSTGNTTNCMKLDQVLKLHKKKFGYQIQPQTLGVSSNMIKAVEMLPYVEVKQKDHDTWLICHNNNLDFRLICYRVCKLLLKNENAEQSTALVVMSGSIRPCSVKTLLSDFNAKHKVQLTESALLAMRHLIEIYNDPDTEIQSVRLTNFMKFLMNIVRLLEQRPNMYVYEIRSALECGLTTTFEFGFPNLYSIIAAYDDIFTINNGPTQERSDVTLNNNCELRQSNHPNLFGSEKMTYAKPRTQQRNFSTYSQAPPPLKIRALGSDFAPGFVSNLSFKAEVNNLQTYQESGGLMLAPNKSSPPSTNSSLLSSLESCRSNYSLYSNWFNKEKSMHDSSLKLFNSSFNSSGDLNASLGAGDLTNITSSTAIMADAALDERSSSKLWHRRQASLYKQPIQNQLQAHPLGHHSEIDTGELYESIKSLNESQNLNTAPPEKIPFWIDPIWSNRFEPYPNNNILNIRLPELKSSHKVIPTMLLSPYTISKNENLKRKLFNFDNHDRNIA